MNDIIILVCAVGRSGSTTTQRILNTMPNSNICGENMGAVNNLLEFYKNIKRTTFDYVPGQNNPVPYEDLIRNNYKPCWYNSYKLTEIQEMIRETIRKLFKRNPDNNIWGFKEIRYDAGKIHYIKEFKELFPQTKVVIQVRENLLNQLNSGWYKNDKTAKQFIIKMNKDLVEFYKKNKEWCYFLTFENLFNENILKEMFIFLNCHQYFNREKINYVLNNNMKD